MTAVLIKPVGVTCLIKHQFNGFLNFSRGILEAKSAKKSLIIKFLITKIAIMASIIINCAGDSGLARKINDYLMDKICPVSDTIYISLWEDEVEIILEKLHVSRDDIRKLLHNFVGADPELARYYSITEFHDVFVIGVPKRLDEMTVNCEMCGYIASSEEDLNLHKRTHGLVFIL